MILSLAVWYPRWCWWKKQLWDMMRWARILVRLVPRLALTNSYWPRGNGPFITPLACAAQQGRWGCLRIARCRYHHTCALQKAIQYGWLLITLSWGPVRAMARKCDSCEVQLWMLAGTVSGTRKCGWHVWCFLIYLFWRSGNYPDSYKIIYIAYISHT